MEKAAGSVVGMEMRVLSWENTPGNRTGDLAHTSLRCGQGLSLSLKGRLYEA